MPQPVLVAASAVMAVAWIPIGLYFFRAWRSRKSPLSLAICGLVALPVYLNSMTSVFLGSQPEWFCTVLFFVNLTLFANFIFCFYWQRKSFPENRKLKEKRGNHKPRLS